MSRLCALALAATCACAISPPAADEPPHLFVGHSDSGEVLVSATHADAMRGLAVPASQLDIHNADDPDGAVLCRREVPTGTHLPFWSCRYVSEIEHDRLGTRTLLDRLPKKCTTGKFCVFGQ